MSHVCRVTEDTHQSLYGLLRSIRTNFIFLLLKILEGRVPTIKLLGLISKV